MLAGRDINGAGRGRTAAEVCGSAATAVRLGADSPAPPGAARIFDGVWLADGRPAAYCAAPPGRTGPAGGRRGLRLGADGRPAAYRARAPGPYRPGRGAHGRRGLRPPPPCRLAGLRRRRRRPSGTPAAAEVCASGRISGPRPPGRTGPAGGRRGLRRRPAPAGRSISRRAGAPLCRQYGHMPPSAPSARPH